jgi:hypothetical protein
MNGRDDARELTDEDRELLAYVDTLLHEPTADAAAHEPSSIHRFSARLADAAPQVDPIFHKQLGERLATAYIARRSAQPRRRVPAWFGRSSQILIATAAGVTVIALLIGLIVSSLRPAAPPVATAPTAAAQTAQPAPTSVPPTTIPATLAPSPTAAPTPIRPVVVPGQPFPLRRSELNIGVVSHLYYTDRERVLTLTQSAGFEWVRQQIVWKDVEGPTPGNYVWDEVDNIVNDVSAHNLKLLVNITQSPPFYTDDGSDGLPNDPKPLGDFIQAMAERYGNKIAAYEIWNEPNLAVENGGRVTAADAGRYVELLAESYNRIKQVSPAAYVLAGAPSSSGVNNPTRAMADLDYLRAMYEYKDGMIKDFFDAQATHPGGSANPPDTLWPELPSSAQGWTDDSTFYFRHVENVRNLMIEYSLGERQIWVTEFGWATPNTTPGYEFGNQMTFERQAEFIIGAINRTYTTYQDEQGRSWVGVMFLWNMNWSVLRSREGEPEHEQASFSILNPDWSPRPAYLALQGYLAQLRQQRERQ